MDSYTITIAPNDDSGAATRLVVDTSGDQVRITDVHLHAPLGLSSGHIPTVDFALLLQAVTGWETTAGELHDTARRIVAAKRQFNLLAGWTLAEDTLPARFLSTPLPNDPAAVLTRDALDALVAEYHRQRAEEHF